MNRFSRGQKGTGLVLGGLAAVVAVGIGLYASGTLFPSPTPENVETPAVAILPEAPETASGAEQDGAEHSAPDQTVVAAVPEDTPEPPVPEVPKPEAPTFDIVRVAPDGQTLVAGTAPGARDVRVLVDGVDAGAATVDIAGQFVAFLDLPSSDQPRVVSLVSEGDQGSVGSLDQVILAPSVQIAAVEAPAPSSPDATEDGVAQSQDTAPDAPIVAEAAPEPLRLEESGQEDVAVLEVAPTADASEAVDAGPIANTAPQPAPPVEAPAVILSTEAGVEVLQPATSAPPAVDQIALDAITYDDVDTVALSGRGTADEFVRVYLDNQPVLTTEIAPDGRWRADLPDVDSGTYTLRVDAVNAEGTVTSRVESPFRREDRDALAAAIERGETAATVQLVTVQPGNTLWAIARDRYGEGPAYVRVFEANRDRIRNPDLIYPGQVFSIPN